jgi:aryl-alcohol dehydrogenase-like predicted oxidoreductase
VREAVDAGINLLDMAPRYGDGEAERVIGEAFGGRLPDGVRVTTKHRVSNPPADQVLPRLESSLRESLERMKLERVDLYILHGYLVEADSQGAERRTPKSLFSEAVREAFELLAERGLIGSWGITAVGRPGPVLEAISESPRPGAIQAIANALDSAGEMKWFEEPARPREIIEAAHRNGVGVMGIRAVGAGALTDRIDRDLPADSVIASDFHRAARLRELARQLGESTASVAHRYALSIPGVDTVVLGVKNREELRDCLDAEARGPLRPELVSEIDGRVPAVA